MTENLRDIIPRFRTRETPSILTSILPSPDLDVMVSQLMPNDTLEHLSNFRLPEFQRPAVWTQPQETRLIESIWRGIPIGTYSVNRLSPTDERYQEFSELLLDGQQRVRAIVNYINDEFPVFNRLYSELSPSDKAFFKQSKFAHCETSFTDWNSIREYYDTMNFGGVAHEPEMKATQGYRRPVGQRNPEP